MSDNGGGHYYKHTGEPCHQVPAKSKGIGGMRNVWISDAIALSLVPSVTTVKSGAIPAPALVDYFVDQAIDAALTMTRLAGEDDVSFKKRIKSDAKEAAKAAAEEGSRIHRAIEDHFDGRPIPDYYAPHVAATLAELDRIFPDVHDWISEKTFAHSLGFGGAVDLHSPSTGIVVDFKSKDSDFSDGKKLAFDQNIQLAAYAIGLCLAGGKDELAFVPCANIFVSRTHPGKVASHIWDADEIADGWHTFECALAMWKQLNKYRSEF